MESQVIDLSSVKSPEYVDLSLTFLGYQFADELGMR